jgi:hypothetical protein
MKRPLHILSVTFSLALSCLSVLFHPTDAKAITVDEFQVDDGVLSSTTPNIPSSIRTASSRALGGGRKLTVIKTGSGTGRTTMDTETEILGITMGDHPGFASIIWDGDATSASSLKANGLGSIDLTQDGSSAFVFELRSFDYPSDATITIRIYDPSLPNGTKFSQVAIVINQQILPANAFQMSVPFSLFTTSGNSTIPAPGGSTFSTTTTFSAGGASPTAVGALAMMFDGNAADLTLTAVSTNGSCTALPNSSGSVFDECGVCLDSVDANQGKDLCGVCFKGPPGYNYDANKVFDGCGLCPTQTNYEFPAGKKDSCGVCLSGQPPYQYKDPKDDCGLCPSAPNYQKSKDPCGVCGGDGSSCADCTGTPNGSAKIDQCGVCAGNGTTCLDCAGQPFGSAALDACGVCGGNGTSCLDCNGVANGSSTVDACGVCGGTATTTESCVGLINSCITVAATDEVKAYEKTLVAKAKSIRTRYNDERKRARRTACKINIAPGKQAVTAAYGYIIARSKQIFSKGVEVCGNSCITTSYAEQVQALLPDFKTMQKETLSLARKVKQCYSSNGLGGGAGGQRGVSDTIGSVNQGLRELIEKCRKQRVCPPGTK